MAKPLNTPPLATWQRWATEGLLAFIPRLEPRFNSPRHLAEWCALIERAAQGEPVRALCSVPIRHYKAIADETPMLTERGWVRADEIRVGDRVPGSSGEFVKVIGVHPQGVVPLFRVRFTDSAELVTCADHRWLTHHQDRPNHPRVMTTAEIVKKIDPNTGRINAHRLRIPLVAPVDGHHEPLPIDPYLLGLWLGDGSSYKAEITTMDPEIVQAIADAGYATSYAYKRGLATTYGIRGLWKQLRDLELVGRTSGRKKRYTQAPRKHVPDIYLRANAGARLAVLQGLADTDGTVAKNGSQQSICTTSTQLLDGIQTLVASLGGKSTVCVVQPPIGEGMKNLPKLAYIVSFRLPNGLSGFRLARKADRLRPPSNRNKPRRFIKSVEPAGEGYARCFTVDAPDHLFCAGRRFVVTHNSETTMCGIVWCLVQDPSMRIIVLTHSFDRAKALGKRIRQLAEIAKVGPEYGMNLIDNWSNIHGGGVTVMSAEQSKLGADVHLLFFDDPLDEHASMVYARREAVDETISHYTARCMRRGRPGAVLGVMSRWHPDDPVGRRLRRGAVRWEYVHHPAISEDEHGEERAFAPEVWPLEELRRMRAESAEQDPTEKRWYSQFQGDPKPEGSGKFRPDPERYDALPQWGFRMVYGCDLAFTQGAQSDYFAIVAMKIIGTKAYLLEVQRTQLDAHMIESTCNAFTAKYGAAPIYSYVSGPEVGMVKLMRQRGLRFVPLKARYNKLVRAEKTIKRWNDGNIVVPQSGPWVTGFLHRVELFRGEDKGHDDDEVDALVSACDGGFGSSAAGGVKLLGQSYAGMGTTRAPGENVRGYGR